MKKIVHFFLCFMVSGIYVKAQPAEIPSGTLKSAGIDSGKVAAMVSEISTQGLNIHSVLILRDNRLVFEKYFRGKDEIFTVPLGEVDHSADSLHDCRSLTKSVVSACIGIAIAQHKIKSIDDGIFLYLPEYAKYDKGEKHDMTIRHLLTMSAGLEWDEKIPYSDPKNSELRMFMAHDAVDFVLSRPLNTKPGTVWNYSGGCTQLLAKIIENVTGEKIDVFAEKNLFTPVGIEKYSWYIREDGTCWAPSGLRLRSIDIARFGSLYLNTGKGNSREIIPANWVKESLSKQIDRGKPTQGYGFQFWCTKTTIAGKQIDMAMAIGFGGQRIYLIPDLSLEIVVTAGNYNDQTDLPDELVSKYIFQAVK